MMLVNLFVVKCTRVCGNIAITVFYIGYYIKPIKAYLNIILA